MTLQLNEQSGNGCCKNCGNGLISDDVKGYTVCDSCGYVHDVIMVDPTYQLTKKRSDAPNATAFVALGNRPNILDGMGSYIGHFRNQYFIDGTGTMLSSRKQKKFSRLKRVYETRIRIGNKEAMYRALRRINHVCALLGVSHDIRDEAGHSLKKAIKLMRQQGMFTDHIKFGCACLVAALRKGRAPVSDQQLIDMFMPESGRGPRYISKAKEWLQTNMDMVFFHEKPFMKWIPSAISTLRHNEVFIARLHKKGQDPNTYFSRLTKGVEMVAEKLTSWDYQGKAPRIVAASMIYAVSRNICGTAMNQTIAATSTDTAEYSIRDHYKHLWKPFFEKHKLTLP